MKTFTTVTLTLITAFLSITSAQVTIENGTFVCSPANANVNFCAGTSLVTNIIIRCTNGKGQPGNCNDNLAGIPPVGVKFSPCYQSSPSAGDAACSFNGIVYPDTGAPFPVPGSTPSVSATGTGSTASAAVPIGTGVPPTVSSNGTGVVTTTSSPPVPTFTGGAAKKGAVGWVGVVVGMVGVVGAL